MTENHQDSATWWCRLFGHKIDYQVVQDGEDVKTIVDATCRRDGCDYEQRLDENWKQTQEAMP